METILNWKHKASAIFLFILISTFATIGQKLPEVRVNQIEVSEETLFIEANRERLMGNYDEAEENLKKLISTYGEKAAYFFEMSKLFQEIGELEKAKSFVERAINLEPENEWYWQYRAEIGIESEDHVDVIYSYESLAKLFPDRHYYLENIAFHQLHNDDPKAALQTLNTLEKRVGINYETTRQQHLILDEMNQVKAASKILDTYLSKYPRDERVIQIAAAYAYNNNDIEGAIRYYEKLLDVNPNHAQAKSALMKLKGKDDMPDALGAFIQDKNVSLDDKIFHLIPMLTDIQMGKQTVALESLESHAMTLENMYGPNAKIAALKGDIFSLNNKLEAAVTSYKSAISIDDNNYLVWESLLYLLVETKDVGSLSQYAEEAMDIFPNKPMPHAFFAVADALKGNFNGVDKNLKRARMIAGNNSALINQVTELEGFVERLREQ